MHVAGTEVVLDVGGHGLGLGDLLGLQALPLKHVLEVHVAAHVELVGAVQHDTAVLEELGQHPVGDGRADLALDVVTDDRDTGVGELLRPRRGAGDEDGQRVDERHVGVDGALGVELCRLLRPDGQVADHHVDLGVAQCLHHVDRGVGGLLDGLHVVLAEAVEGVTPLDGDTGGRHVGKLDGVVLAGADGVGEVLADLLAVDVERCHEVDVTHVVLAQHDVHQPGDAGLGIGVAVVLDALHQRRCAVADADDGYADAA